jgi:hypothetical protein
VSDFLFMTNREVRAPAIALAELPENVRHRARTPATVADEEALEHVRDAGDALHAARLVSR